MSPSESFKTARDVLLRHRDDLPAACREFAWPKLDRFNWALDWFDTLATTATHPALWVVADDGSETRVSFAQMRERSDQVANFLRRQGVRRGDRILVMLPNQIALWELMLASIKLGAVIIPATLLLTADDLADRVRRGDVRHVVASFGEAGKFDGIPGAYSRIAVGGGAPGWISYEDSEKAPSAFVPDGETRADDPMLLYFTSGTTSKPKLVMHSHESYPVGHLSTMYWIGLKPGDVHWNISSPGWAKHAWSCFFAPWNAGATVFVYNYARFRAASVLDAIVRCGVTSLCAPPTVWRMMIQENLKAWPVKLRELISAGEPLNPEVIERVKAAWGITIRDGFGQTETTCVIGNSPSQRVKPGSMGRPMPGYAVELLSPEGAPADEGEISIVMSPRPTGVMQGYSGDPDKTADVMRGARYRTGDVAMRDAEGYFTYVGRADDVFKASDYRISPFELESILIEHEAVAEAAVVPSPDALRLAVPKCFVALREGHVASRDLALSILRHARDRLAPYKRIRRLEFVDLPKTVSGKIRRVDLRRREEARTDTVRGPSEFWEEDLPELK